MAGCLHPASIPLCLSVLHCVWGRAVCAQLWCWDRVCLGLYCFLCGYMCKALSLCHFCIFLKSLSLLEHGKSLSTRLRRQLDLITQKSCNRGSVCAPFLAGKGLYVCWKIGRPINQNQFNKTEWLEKDVIDSWNGWLALFVIWILQLILTYDCQVWQLYRGQALNLNLPSLLLGCLQTRQSLMVLN